METKRYFIVAIDDDDTILDMYKSGLVDFEVTAFSNPIKAKEFLFSNQKKPDLILMDIMMPNLDGISFIREIRSNDNLSSIPIITVSGLADAATLNDAMLFGATDYVIKPFDIIELSDKIKNIIRKYSNRTNKEAK
ncbi:MAG: response regulator [Elusimicrobiales bacterium]|nr:response regulator [Elusimicrobiales bacterium]